jgi:hypothetical protein
VAGGSTKDFPCIIPALCYLVAMLVTKDHIDYKAAPYGFVAHIPAGVAVTPANNLPGTIPSQYWIGQWPGMNEQAESWQRNYGFLVDASQVAESPFQVGQRVRILPCQHYPGKVRYGIIQGATMRPGMSLIDKDRSSLNGEWAYIVASYRSPLAGALWFSAEGLQAMKRVPASEKWCYAKA